MVGTDDEPVCPLVLALYGHPDAGGYWERHCTERLMQCNFQPIDQSSWRSVFWHETLKLLLVVYVDDFKLAGPAENVPKGWDLIGGLRENGEPLIKLEAPGPVGRYLGCQHVELEAQAPHVFDPRSSWTEFEEPKKAAPLPQQIQLSDKVDNPYKELLHQELLAKEAAKANTDLSARGDSKAPQQTKSTAKADMNAAPLDPKGSVAGPALQKQGGSGGSCSISQI